MRVITQFALFFIYAALIVIVAKYLMMHFIRKLSKLLHLSTEVTGQIIGYATSIPELIGTIAAAAVGFIATSMFNILSSNIINIFLFLLAVFVYKGHSKLLNKDYLDEYIIILVTVIIPLVILLLGIQIEWWLVPILASMYLAYLIVNKRFNSVMENNIEQKCTGYDYLMFQDSSANLNKNNIKKIIYYIFMLLVSALLLYFLGNKLGNTLEILGNIFKIPEMILGTLMGFITSLPELTSFLSSYSYYKEREEDDKATLEAINNLTSSNVCNLFLIQTIGILIYVILY